MTLELGRLLRHRVIPAVPVPFNRSDRIDEAAQAAYVRWMAGQPVGAVAVWAHTGRGLWLSDEQRALVLAAWSEGIGKVPVLCGVGVPRNTALPSSPGARTDAVIAATVRLAEDARQGGAAGVLVHPPTALSGMRDIDSRLVALHQAVADVGLPGLAFYLYEAAGGVAYLPRTLELLLDIEGIVGLKLATLDSVMTFQDLVSMITAQSDTLVITGEDRFLGYSLMLGAQAALVGIAAACTQASAALLDAWFGADYRTFVAQTMNLDAFAQATFVDPMEGYVQRMLWALAADGVIWTSRDAFAPPLEPEERARVERAVTVLRES